MAAGFALSSCGGDNIAGAPPASLGPQGRPVVGMRGHSWMKPGSKAQKLLYVTNYGSATVTVYAYPSLSYTGELTGFVFPLFDCADRAGNVWIVDYGAGTATKYAHGGTTPIRQLTDLSNPYQCGVDRKTGDLAVAVNDQASSQSLGQVAVYHKAKGSPSIYSDANFGLISGLAYDSNGNIFVDGYTPDDQFHYAELPAGSSTFTDITLSETPGSPGSLAWDGHYVDVGDYSNTIYQTQGATVVNTIDLTISYPSLRGFSMLSRKQLIAADGYGNAVDIFAYPAGGTPTKTITYALDTPWDVVLSK